MAKRPASVGYGRIEVTFEGIDKIIGKLATAPNETKRAVAQVINELSEEVLYRSNEYVPVDKGTLRSSGNVIRAKNEGNAVVGGVGYGGAASKYAVYVHENLNANHPKGGQAKYLERATDEVKPFIARVMGERLPQILKV